MLKSPGMKKRRWLLWILIASFGWLVISRFNEIENLAETLSRGIWLWVLVAATFQVIYYLAQARVYQVSFSLVQVKSRLLELVPVLLGSMFINAVAPSGGTAGVALFVDDAVQRGQSAARATAGTLLAVVGIYGGFGPYLLAALLYLQSQGLLNLYQLVAAVALLAFSLLMSSLLLLGWLRPGLLQRLLAAVQALANKITARLRRPPLLQPQWAAKTAGEFEEAAQAIRGRPRGLLSIIFWAAVAQLLNAASLYAFFLAFRHTLTAGALLAGYAMGHLFVIIAPTPQGVGFVETIMPLVFTSFTVPPAVATIVVLAYRGLSFWLPLLTGFFLLQRLQSLGAREQDLTELWSVRIVAMLTALLGVLNILTGLSPALARELAPVARYVPLQIQRGGIVAAVLTGFALLLLANALWRRKRTGWLLALVVLVLSAISYLLQGSFLSYRVLLTLALVAWLVSLRPHFHARSDPPSVRQGVQVLAVALAFNVLYGALGLYLLSRPDGPVLDLPAAVGQTVVMFFSLQPPSWLLATETGRFLAFSIYTIGSVTLLYSLLLLIRPVLLRRPATAAERARAEAIVRRYGHTALARLALRPDKAYFFSPGGSVVAFQVKGRVAVALGDPIGPPADRLVAIASFTRHCARNDWVPAFYQVRAQGEEAYRQAGYDSVAVGREAVLSLPLSPQNYGVAGRQVASLLQDGHYAACFCPPLSSALVAELQRVSDSWLALLHATESGFALSWFDATGVGKMPVVTVSTPDGVVTAFATLFVDEEHGQVEVDLLRQRPQAVSGTLELLLLAALQWAQVRHFKQVNLGVNFLDATADPATESMLHYIYRRAGENQMPRAAHQAKAQFQPEWRLRYLVYPGPASLPAVWAAVIRVSASIGWSWLFLRQRFRL